MLNTSISFRPQRLSKLNKNYPLKTPIFNNFKTHKSFFVAPETGIYTVPTFANKRFYSDKKDDSKVNKYDEDEEDSRPATDEEIAETKEIMELFRQPKMKFHGDLNVPDYHYAFRDPDGKLRDAEGHEYGVTPSGEAEGVTDYTFEKYYKGLSITAKKHIAQFDKGAHEETIRFLKRAKILALRKIGVDEDLVITKDLPIEELKKVWDHVIRLSPEPMATTIMNFDAGTLEKRTIRFSDPFIHFITTRRYFLEHPNKTYLALSGLFMLGVIVALLIALYDNFLVEHEGSQQDRDKTYVRSRLLSSVAYTLAGIGAILLSAKLTTTHLLNRPPSASRTIAFGSFPLYLMFYFLGTYQNYPEKRPWGKLAIFGCLTAAAGASISAYTLRRGPGLVKLLVPVAAASLAGSASVAISPFDVNLEYGLPLAVLSATFAGLFGASAIFPAYRSYTRGSLATIFALSYAGLFLSYQQPLLNRIKFQEHYYGTEAFSNNSMLFLKSITFMPLKFYEYSSDALVTYYPKSILDLILPEPKDL